MRGEGEGDDPDGWGRGPLVSERCEESGGLGWTRGAVGLGWSGWAGFGPVGLFLFFFFSVLFLFLFSVLFIVFDCFNSNPFSKFS